jgi:all-trans-retinol 13,14-reductase
MWDAIVIGSGVGGLAAAAALARRGRRVLVLERHRAAGGLTQTFRRQEWSFAPGVHYLGGVGPDPGPAGQFGRVLAWLTNDALRFADCGNPYDIVRLPGFEFGIEHPEAAYRQALHARFADQGPAIERWFEEMREARAAAFALIAQRAMPAWMAWAARRWGGAETRHYANRTVAQALAGIADARLRAVLGARWGDYGAPPARAPLLEHAMVTGAYNGGSYYPVGGPARFAQALLPVIENAGGALRLGAAVRRIVTQHGRVQGVDYERDGERKVEPARHVVSAMGLANTVACLDAQVAPAWRQRVEQLEPGLSYLCLYLGFEGDIGAAGASAANYWIAESVEDGGIWRRPADDDAPALFVSFPSLKDPDCQGKPTAEVVATCDAEEFAPWLDLPEGERPEAYLALKARIEARMLAQFKRHFPALAGMIRFHELSTPVTQRRFVGTPGGAMYGLDVTAQRMASPALDLRTPVSGLLLAGQDVFGPGVPSACMSGLLAASAIEPALLSHLQG